MPRSLVFLASLILSTSTFLAGAVHVDAQCRPGSARCEPSRAPAREPHGGAHLEVGAMLGPHLAMGGGSLGWRVRPSRWFALDLGLGYYEGVGTRGSERWELQASVGGRFYVNPEDDWRLVLVGAVSASYAVADTKWMYPPGSVFYDYTTEDYGYLAGELGAGVEWPIARHLSLEAEARGFVRTRTDDQQGWSPDYRDPATGVGSNTSAGVRVLCGATVHW